MTDWELLRRYIDEHSEDAFRTLVERHANIVFSAALRATAGNHSAAEDITQRTFTLFARQAARLRPRVIIAGWLYRAALNLGRDARRAEQRRALREKEALSMENARTDLPLESPEQFTAKLDDALSALSQRDRDSIILRFFQQRTMREVGVSLGISEEAAKMRVSRALERLRQQFARLGVTLPLLTLATLLSQSTAEAAVGVVEAAVAGAFRAGPPSTFIGLSKILVMTTTMKAGLCAGLLVAGALLFHPKRGNVSPGQPAHSNAAPLRSPSSDNFAEAAPHSAESAEPIHGAVLELRHALNDPWTSRRIPYDRVDRVLASFRGSEPTALPEILRIINTPRRERSFDAFVLAAHALEALGTNAVAALPDVLKLMREGDLAMLNDGLPKLLNALSPDGALLPELLDALRLPGLRGASQIGAAVNQMITANPGLESPSFKQLHALLDDPDLGVRRQAATVLARLPTLKDPDALPPLLDALTLQKLRDPKAYDPIHIPEQSTTILRDGERFDDEVWRFQAVQALKDFGPGARDAVPALREAADLLPSTNETSLQLRNLALAAIAAIQPDSADPAVAAADESARHARELHSKIDHHSVTPAELIAGLSDSRTVSRAAESLQDYPEEARRALPELLRAIDRFGDYEAAQTLKHAAPEALVARLKQRNWRGLSAVANALGDLGPAVEYAIPYLEEAFAGLKSDDQGTNGAVGEALRKINPGYPQPVFHWDDLHPAMSVLLSEIYRTEKTRSPVYDAYIRDMRDLNNVPRPVLLKFIERTKADPELHDVFVAKLFETNPSLRLELASNK